MVNKVFATAAEAVADVPDGASLAVGGFGLVGIPSVLIDALLAQGATDLETVSNNCGTDGFGLGLLLEQHRIRRTISSYVGANKEFARQYLSPAFYTPAGVGTQVADGGLPIRYDGQGGIAVASKPKETREFDGEAFVLERAIRTDFALVHAWKGDRLGNLVYRETARNFNPDAAGAGRITIAQVEYLVEPGEIDPAEVHTPGIFVQRVVEVGKQETGIENRTVRA